MVLYSQHNLGTRFIDLYMIAINAETFVRLAIAMKVFADTAETAGDEGLSMAIRREMGSRLKTVLPDCKSVGLEASIVLIEELLSLIQSGSKATTIGEQSSAISKCLRAELKARSLYAIEPSKRSYIDPTEPLFGSEVQQNFSSASPEIRAVGLSYAVGLDTACVFHCMRVVEIGLRAWARCLGIQTPVDYQQWHNVIEQIESEIKKARSAPQSPAKTDQLEQMSKAAIAAHYLKDAWRNHVMHTRRAYDDRESIRVVGYSRDFMRELAVAGVIE